MKVLVLLVTNAYDQGRLSRGSWVKRRTPGSESSEWRRPPGAARTRRLRRAELPPAGAGGHARSLVGNGSVPVNVQQLLISGVAVVLYKPRQCA